MIENVINGESVVAQEGVSRSPNIEDTAREACIPQDAGIATALHQIRKVLNSMSSENIVTQRLLIARGALESLIDDSPMIAAQSSNDQYIPPGQRNNYAEKINSTIAPVHGDREEFQSTITKLTDENEGLRDSVKVFETANNELVSEVDAKDDELLELRDELNRMRQNMSQMNEVRENLEASRKTADRAFRILSSINSKNNTYEAKVLSLKEELKACEAEKEKILKNSKHQQESWEKAQVELVSENERLQGRIAGFKRKLGDVMEDIDEGTPSRKHSSRN